MNQCSSTSTNGEPEPQKFRAIINILRNDITTEQAGDTTEHPACACERAPMMSHRTEPMLQYVRLFIHG
jgi:hypothetical protein